MPPQVVRRAATSRACCCAGRYQSKATRWEPAPPALPQATLAQARNRAAGSWRSASWRVELKHGLGAEVGVHRECAGVARRGTRTLPAVEHVKNGLAWGPGRIWRESHHAAGCDQHRATGERGAAVDSHRDTRDFAADAWGDGQAHIRRSRGRDVRKSGAPVTVAGATAMV